jgi:ribosomal protein S14
MRNPAEKDCVAEHLGAGLSVPFECAPSTAPSILSRRGPQAAPEVHVFPFQAKQFAAAHARREQKEQRGENATSASGVSTLSVARSLLVCRFKMRNLIGMGFLE